MEIEIREASLSDLPDILLLHSYLEFDESKVLTLSEAERVCERIKKYPNYKIYIGIVDNVVVATFALLIMERLGHKGTPSGIVEDIVVHPQWRRKGIGKSIIQFAMERCKEKGCYKLTLSSNMKRLDAHLFYDSVGFKKHGYSFVIDFK
ncbi:MAG: GNAT family N-acetyltransferase [Thermodesulfovibrionales bacterium]|nr:GNAT family N-acetyltransferase [Thermodesulfovibrionales bacterium]